VKITSFFKQQIHRSTVQPLSKAAIVLSMVVSGLSFAQSSIDPKIEADIRSKMPDGSVLEIKATPISNIYQVEMAGGELLHATQDGNYLLTGDILAVKPSATGEFSVSNLTEAYRGERRGRLIKNLDQAELITYPAKNKKIGDAYVFTDTDCGYCRKFHAEIPEMTAKGIAVHYLAWPRAGVSSKTGKTMVDIWCAKDRHKAMDSAKRGSRVSSTKEGVESCIETVSQQRKVGEQLGVRGTPAVYLEDGQQVGGYLKADQLLKALKQ